MIEPTYEADRYKLFLGDCIPILREFSDNSIDSIITDPPYNVSVKNSKIVRGKGTIFEGGNISLDFGEWDRNKIYWIDFIDDFARILTPVGILVMFYDKLYLGQIGCYLQDKYGFQVRHIGNYIKSNPAPQARKVKWQNGCESFLIATKNKKSGHHFNYRLGQSPDYYRRSNNYKRTQPTQKPLDLMEWIVKYWSFEEDTILDPFMGSGTTGEACLNLNRKFIGIENKPEHFQNAYDRISSVIKTP